jgi:hypothetical protein
VKWLCDGDIQMFLHMSNNVCYHFDIESELEFQKEASEIWVAQYLPPLLAVGPKDFKTGKNVGPQG